MRNPRAAVMLFFAAALCGCADHHGAVAKSAAPEDAVRIVVLGDSLGLGTGASNPSGGFTYRIYEHVAMRRPGSTIRNLSIGGTRARDVLRLEVPSLRDVSADIVIVVAGANDVVRRTPAGDFTTAYRELISAIKRAQPHARLILCGVPDIGISPLFAGPESRTLAVRSRDDDAAVRRIARGAHASVIDLYAISTKAQNDTGAFLSADRFHPSDVGYERIAEAAYPIVTRALAGGRAP